MSREGPLIGFDATDGDSVEESNTSFTFEDI